MKTSHVVKLSARACKHANGFLPNLSLELQHTTALPASQPCKMLSCSCVGDLFSVLVHVVFPSSHVIACDPAIDCSADKTIGFWFPLLPLQCFVSYISQLLPYRWCLNFKMCQTETSSRRWVGEVNHRLVRTETDGALYLLCLQWIGLNLGIKKASFLSVVFHFGYDIFCSFSQKSFC